MFNLNNFLFIYFVYIILNKLYISCDIILFLFRLKVNINLINLLCIPMYLKNNKI